MVRSDELFFSGAVGIFLGQRCLTTLENIGSHTAIITLAKKTYYYLIEDRFQVLLGRKTRRILSSLDVLLD